MRNDEVHASSALKLKKPLSNWINGESWTFESNWIHGYEIGFNTYILQAWEPMVAVKFPTNRVLSVLCCSKQTIYLYIGQKKNRQYIWLYGQEIFLASWLKHRIIALRAATKNWKRMLIIPDIYTHTYLPKISCFNDSIWGDPYVFPLSCNGIFPRALVDKE